MKTHSNLSHDELLAEIIKLKKENKALKENCDGFILGAVTLTKMVEDARQSRDELLSCLYTFINSRGLTNITDRTKGEYRKLLQKAEQQKGARNQMKCDCRKNDSWRCAADRNLTKIFCPCDCHKQKNQETK